MIPRLNVDNVTNNTKTHQHHVHLNNTHHDNLNNTRHGSHQVHQESKVANNSTAHGKSIIPKIVHQEYKDEDLPANMKAWREGCMRLNPDWEFKLWTDDMNQQLIEEDYPHLLDLYNGYDQKIKRIDMIRFVYLHKFGGVYIDLDVACMKPFGTIFQEYPNKFIVVNQFKKQRDYANNIMAASEGHEIFQDIFNTLPSTKRNVVIESAGGLFLQYHVLPKTKNKGKWVEFPFDLFNAQDWQNSKSVCLSYEACTKKYPNAITISMWTGTWAGNDPMRETRRWSNTSSLVPSITNYTISTENRNEIFVSGTYDKDFCWECIWKEHIGTPCHRRADYIVVTYKQTIKKTIDDMLKGPPRCRDTTSPTSQYFLNTSQLSHNISFAGRRQ